MGLRSQLVLILSTSSSSIFSKASGMLFKPSSCSSQTPVSLARATSAAMRSLNSGSSSTTSSSTPLLCTSTTGVPKQPRQPFEHHLVWRLHQRVVEEFDALDGRKLPDGKGQMREGVVAQAQPPKACEVADHFGEDTEVVGRQIQLLQAAAG
eukprot:scaffold7342_cov269-Pinguiococcus_pyrenoidosus.AAC.5